MNLLFFTDYLGIYTNKKYDEAFRNQAGEMISKLFANGMSTEIHLLNSWKENKCNLHDSLTIWGVHFGDIQ